MTIIHPVRTATFESNLTAVWFIFKNRLSTYSRYKGQVIMSIVSPIIMATIPILMGTAIAGDPTAAQESFVKNAQLQSNNSYQGYMLIGALLFTLVSNSLWNFGFWLRREQTTGTLESGVYLVPTSKAVLIAGSSLYVLVRNSVSFVIALVLGVFIFSIQIGEFLSGTLILGIFVLLIGLPPIIGLALLFGAFILKFKEIGSLIDIMQWILSFLMGVFYPILLLPPMIRIVAQILPPTWTANSIRAALYDAPYFINFWADIIVQLGFALIFPVIALAIFYKIESGVIKADGIGKY